MGYCIMIRLLKYLHRRICWSNEYHKLQEKSKHAPIVRFLDKEYPHC